MNKLIEKFKALKKELLKSQKILLVAHLNPDVDSLGSVFAFDHYLRNELKKKTTLLSVDEISPLASKLFSKKQIENTYNLPDYDTIMILDREDTFYKLKMDEEMREKNLKIKVINIDHHPKPPIKGALNLVNIEAAATCEIIYEFFKQINYKIPPKAAQYLLNGIFTDTGGFRHNNTTAKNLEIVSDLMKKGASIRKINRLVFENKSLSALRLWSIALSRAELYKKTGMVISFLTREDLKKCNASKSDASGIAEVLNTISGSKFSLVLYESRPNIIKASLRSDEHKGVDVSEIAKRFKGGGHKLASGFEIKGTLKEVKGEWTIE
ncbi:MAG: bifunctional oligoribonuclease/PAP phosphatase NrnA [Candidatus Moranbacteria bacterium]|nr:bifunctional oligoribonuclease/PAP phosphatase NrnA [Candidatus Moranbacteria bacterium]